MQIDLAADMLSQSCVMVQVATRRLLRRTTASLLWSCLVMTPVQVGDGALEVCQIQHVPGRKRHVWQPCLALELHPRLTNHLCYIPAIDYVGNVCHPE